MCLDVRHPTGKSGDYKCNLRWLLYSAAVEGATFGLSLTFKPPSPDALPNLIFIEYGICEVDSRPTDTGIHVRKCVCVKRDLTTQQRVLFCKEKSPSLQVNGHWRSWGMIPFERYLKMRFTSVAICVKTKSPSLQVKETYIPEVRVAA